MPVIIMIFCIIISLILWNPRNKGIFEEENRLFMTERKPGQKIVCNNSQNLVCLQSENCQKQLS